MTVRISPVAKSHSIPLPRLVANMRRLPSGKMLLRLVAHARLLPSGEIAIALTTVLWPHLNNIFCFIVVASQSVIVSRDADATELPSGVNITAVVWPLWLEIVLRIFPVPTSHNSTSPSKDTDARRLPSGENAASYTVLQLPMRLPHSPLVFMLLIIRLSAPDATRQPSGENFIVVMGNLWCSYFYCKDR